MIGEEQIRGYTDEVKDEIEETIKRVQEKAFEDAKKRALASIGRSEEINPVELTEEQKKEKVKQIINSPSWEKDRIISIQHDLMWIRDRLRIQSRMLNKICEKLGVQA